MEQNFEGISAYNFKAPEVGDPCQHCSQRPSTMIWAGGGGSLAYVHGMYTVWCRQCMIEEQLKYARQQALIIPALEAELEDLNGLTD